MDLDFSSNAAIPHGVTFENTFYQDAPSYIAKIPTEVLSKIFVDAQSDIDPSFPADMDSKTQFFVSWVCRHWRDTAITTSSLWTVFYKKGEYSADADENEIEIAQELLARCRNRRISVNLIRPSPALLDILSPQMRRIQHLKLSMVPADGALDRLLSQPAPVLASFELLGTKITRKRLFAKTHPLLDRVILTDAGFKSPSFLIALNLTTLHIINNNRRSPIHIQDIFDLIILSKNLTDLALFRPSRILGIFHPPQTPVHLPRLQSLSITIADAFSDIFGILRWLDIPQCSISLSSPKDKICSELTFWNSRFFSELDLYHALVHLPLRHMKVECSLPSFIMDISGSPGRHRHSYRIDEENLTEDDVDTFVSLFSAHCPLESLSTNVLPPDALEDFNQSNNLKSLTLYGMSALEDFLGGFLDTFQVSDGDIEEICFPVLRELTICQIEDGVYALSTLQEALIARSAVGLDLRLDKLEFVDCPDVDGEQFIGLAETVSILN